jgi:hypothetical protein
MIRTIVLLWWLLLGALAAFVEFRVKIPSDADIRRNDYRKSLTNITVELNQVPQYT